MHVVRLGYIEVVTLTNNIAQGSYRIHIIHVCAQGIARAHIIRGTGVYAKGESQCIHYRGYFDNDQRSQTSVARRQTHTVDEVFRIIIPCSSKQSIKVDPFY